MRRDLERIALGDLDPVTLEALDFLWIVGEQIDALDAEVAQHLRRNPVVAAVVLEAELKIRLYRIEPLVLQRVGANLVRQTDATALLVHVQQHTLAGLVDALQGGGQLLATVAPLR